MINNFDMDYEKKYNHALEVVRELQKDWASTQNRAAREIELAFPELRESEDERIRQFLIERMNSLYGANSVTPEGIAVNDIVSYLEKQKEPKLVPDDLQKSFEAGQMSIVDNPEQYGLCKKIEWSEEDEHRRQQAINALDRNGYYVLVDWLKSLRPQPKQMPEDWTDKDKRILDDISHLLISFKYTEMAKAYKQAIEKLLYSRPSWKPSEEQMSVLGRFLKFLHESGSPDFGLMDSLLGRLKKL